MTDGIQIAMTCPNEECCADYEVTVISLGRYVPATHESPAEGPEIDLTGPLECAECGESLHTLSETRYAIDRAYEIAADAAMDRYLGSRV